jgi:hypothetical protein
MAVAVVTMLVAVRGPAATVLRAGPRTVWATVVRSCRSRLPLCGLGLAVAYAAILWAAGGAPVDPLVKTDVRLVALAAGTFCLTAYCTAGRARDLAIAVCALAPLLTAKALAIYVSGLTVIGNYDRLQASQSGGDPVRVILIGGDTILVLVPALAMLTWRAAPRLGRIVLAVSGLAAVGGLVVSGTRTSLLVAAGLFCLATAVGWRRPAGYRIVLAAVVALGLLVALLVAVGVGQRFVTPDAPHVGLNFREDEVRSFFELPDRQLVIGQGLGGRFTAKDPGGQLVVTAWMHELPLWVVLKIGFIGAAFVGLLGAIWLRGLVVRRRSATAERRLEAATGLAMAFGIIVMSFTINRAALPEGAVLLTMALTLAGRASSPTSP